MYIIVGAGGSGKSTLQEYLIKNYYKNFNRAISTTTRPMRKRECEGIDYHFVNVYDFCEKENKGELYCVERYNDWFYAIEKKELEKENGLAVLTPAGVKTLKKELVRLNDLDKLNNITVIYLKVDGKSRLKKMLESRSDKQECHRRYIADEKMFENFEEHADIVLENYGYCKTLKELSNELMDKLNNLNKPRHNELERPIADDREI